MGKIEGKIEGKLEIIKNMLAKRYDLNEIIDLTGASKKEILKLAKTI